MSVARTRKAKAPAAAPVPAPRGQERLIGVLLAPHVTEKTTQGQQQRNQYAFRVRGDADRTEVRRAVELMFDVKVDAVRILNTRSKQRRFAVRGARQRTGRTAEWKKAYVRLAAGSSIDYEAQGKR